MERIATNLMTPSRIKTARVIAAGADFLQVVAFPAFFEGWLSPVNDVLDIAVGIVMWRLIGWHWAFLPTFVAEMIPIWGLVPNWTAAVFLVTRNGPVVEIEARPQQ